MNKKLLLLVTEDKWFLTHRVPLAWKACEEGYDVVVVTRVTKYRKEIESLGYRVVPLRISRGGMHPFDEFRSLRELIGIYKREKPDVCHHIGIKYILYGVFAANRAGIKPVVNVFAGLGFVYSSSHWKARLIRPFLNYGLKVLLKRKGIRVIFQNPDDMHKMKASGVVSPDKAVLIRSSGVDLEKFQPTPEPTRIVTAVMAGRLLWPKGVGVFVEAGKILKNQDVDIRMQLVGDPDLQNPLSVSDKTLRAWESDGYVEWLGYSENMPEIWAQANIGVLPTSYGEGVPKVLLEAAASGRALVATDAPGCREIVEHGINGYLVPAKDPEALARALRKLAEDTGLRGEMGRQSRKIVELHFSDKLVAEKTVEVYQRLLASSECE